MQATVDKPPTKPATALARVGSHRFQAVVDVLRSPAVMIGSGCVLVAAIILAALMVRPAAELPKSVPPPSAKAAAAAAAAAKPVADCADAFAHGDVVLASSFAPPYLDSSIEIANDSQRPAVVTILRANGRQRFASVGVAAGQSARVSVQPDKYLLEAVYGTRWCAADARFADASRPVVLEAIEAKREAAAAVKLSSAPAPG